MIQKREGACNGIVNFPIFLQKFYNRNPKLGPVKQGIGLFRRKIILPHILLFINNTKNYAILLLYPIFTPFVPILATLQKYSLEYKYTGKTNSK